MDLSKIEAGKLDFELIPFSISQVLNDIRLATAVLASNKELPLRINLKGVDNLTVVGDPGRLRQILYNFLSNAIKFTNKGQIELSVQLLEERGEDVCLKFEVSDTGIGLSIQSQEKLFKPFSQADNSTTRKYGGTGLGLSISKHLVEKMGGQVGVVSTEGEGSTFWFTTLLKKETGRLLSDEDLKRDEPIERESLKGRCLIADDVSINQIVALKMLEKLGLTGVCVSNGKEVLAALERSSFDLIFMDCHMPEMDGYEATRKIREFSVPKNKRTVIIALTANAMKGDMDKCLEGGMDDYISKPFSAKQLEAVVRKWLLSERECAA